MKPMNRRTFFKVVGQGMAYGLFPISLSSCVPPEPQFVGSYHVPTPEEPLTPNDDFFIATMTATQQVSIDRWKLRLGGQLVRPRTFSLEDLLAFPSRTERVTLECIGNTPGGPFISSADFTGVRFRDLLEEVEPAPNACGFAIWSQEGYVAFHPTDRLLYERNLLAYEMNGEPLPVEHGYPLRAVLPGQYGFVQPKWMCAITAVPLAGLAAHVVDSIVEGTEIDLMSKIYSPRMGEVIPGNEPIIITGIALSSGLGIDRIEVSIDNGVWRQAEVILNSPCDPIYNHLWSIWEYVWEHSTPGPHTIAVRAIDPSGATQPAEDMEKLYNSGTIQQISITVTESLAAHTAVRAVDARPPVPCPTKAKSASRP